MQETIISDSSCIILLDKINELELLHKLFGIIIITPEVHSEFGKDLPDWFELRSPSDKEYQSKIETNLGKGEASSIALAVELKNCLLIVDDLKARKFAEKLNIKFNFFKFIYNLYNRKQFLISLKFVKLIRFVY